MSRSITRISILISLSLSLTACATYQPSEAECFNSFAEVTRSDCSFEMLHAIGPVGHGNG
jgi:hypothetical protein